MRLPYGSELRSLTPTASAIQKMRAPPANELLATRGTVLDRSNVRAGAKPFLARSTVGKLLRNRDEQEFWRTSENLCRIREGMDTRYRPLELSCRWRGDLPVSGQLASSRASSVSNWLANGSSRVEWLLGSHEDSEKQLFVFRILEISNRTHRVGSKPLIFGTKHVQTSARSWRATCKTRVLYANCIQQCERKPRLKGQSGLR